MYIVGFNGPPESGKDTLAAMLVAHMEKHQIPSPIRLESLSLPLRRIAYSVVDWRGELDGPDYSEFKQTYFHQLGVTGRELLIHVSEKYLKPVYGVEVMTRLLLQRNESFIGVLLIRDCGFQIEVNPLIRAVGPENFYLVNVMRLGKDFSNDSREWVNHPMSKCQMQVNNVHGLDDLRVEAGRIYGRLVNQMGWTL